MLLACAGALAGCGEPLGPGASPEADPARSASAGEEAGARQLQAATHFGLPVEVRDARGVRFRLVPPGTFAMGSAAGEPGRGPDEERHPVTLMVPYHMQVAETSWAEVRAWRAELGAGEPDELPARGLSHDEVSEFIAWVNAQDPQWFHRLPTEAEWEHACRSGADARWWSGGTAPADLCAGGRVGGPRGVGKGVPNGYGLHDLHGNVAEWCRPWYAPYPSWAVDLPVGPLRGEERVVRGGSWRDPEGATRSAARAHLPPGRRDPHVGFRLLVEAGYGVPGMGAHELRVQTYDGSIGAMGRHARPGYRLRLVSVPERLTARQEDRPIRWRDVAGTTPLTLRMLPGRFYIQAWREEAGHVVRGAERKFMIPDDLPEVDVEIPAGAAPSR